MASRTGGKENAVVYARYVEWMKIPKKERPNIKDCPTTKEEFAKKHNVNRATLWRWEQDPEFKRDVANEALGLITADELVAIIDGIKQDATDRNLRPRDRQAAAKLLVEWSKLMGDGSITPRKPNDDEDEAFFAAKSDEELEAWLNENGWGDEED